MPEPKVPEQPGPSLAKHPCSATDCKACVFKSHSAETSLQSVWGVKCHGRQGHGLVRCHTAVLVFRGDRDLCGACGMCGPVLGERDFRTGGRGMEYREEIKMLQAWRCHLSP